MPKNLVICFDGTNNQFGRENTNVVRLVQSLDRDPSLQRLYYDPGVGTLPEPGALNCISRKISELCGLAFGAGLTWKIQEAYCYLMDYWEPGDHVFIFGFSRGAYSARVLAGMLHALGLLPRGGHNLVPYAMRLLEGVRKEGGTEDDGGAPKRWGKLCDEFRWTFARPIPCGNDDRRFKVHFLGLWDTVSSVGWVWDPATFPHTAHNPSVEVVRHAVSVDERRWFFRQNLVMKVDGQDLLECWFPGVHSDVGGGYSDSGLWQGAFDWILAEATKAGLLVDQHRLNAILSKVPQRPWLQPQHESLTPVWWLAEFFPKLRWFSRLHMRLPQIGLGRHRHVHPGALIEYTTLMRIRECGYAPPNLSDNFRQRIRNLAPSNVPQMLPYQP
jgi:uncharacterized protein (DUF2235 family)